MYLWRRIAWTAAWGAKFGSFGIEVPESKINQFYDFKFIQKDIFWLQIPMDYPEPMEVVQGSNNLLEEAACLLVL